MRHFVMISITAALALGACDDGGSSGDDDTTVADTAVADTAVADTAVADTNVADTNVDDTTVADTTVADTTVEDTTVEDTTVEDTTVADTTPPVDTTPPPMYRVFVDSTTIEYRSGKILVVNIGEDASTCAAVDSDAFTLSSRALTVPPGDNPCSASSTEAWFEAGEYTLTAGVFTPGSTVPDKGTSVAVTIVDQDVTVTIPGDELSGPVVASDDCTDVPLIGPGTGYQARTSDQTDDHDLYQNACRLSNSGGYSMVAPDAGFAVQIPPRSLLIAERVKAIGAFSNNARIALSETCEDADGTCHRMGKESAAWLNMDTNTTVDATLMVDGLFGGDTGILTFDLTVTSVDALPEMTSCGAAKRLTGKGPHTLSGNTTGGYNVHDGYTSTPCGTNQQANGPDHVYVIEIPAGHLLKLVPVSGFGDARYGVFDSCAELETSCRFFSQFLQGTRNTTDEAVDFYFVVDGRDLDDAGSYNVTATIEDPL